MEPIVEVRPGGSVRGRRTDHGNVFLGIPYAAPPSTPRELFAAIQGDWLFRIRTQHLADAHATGPAATYRTSSRGPPRPSTGAWAPATGWRSPSCSTRAPPTPTR